MFLIRHTPDGIPYARPYLGKDADGKIMRPYREFPNMTDDEAAQAASVWIEEWSAKHTAANGITTAQALGEYVDQMAAFGRSNNTIRMYRHFTDCYLLDLATKPANCVTTQDLDNLFQKLLTQGASSGKPLSEITVQTFRAFLQGAWKVFVRHGTVSNNVARDTMRIHATRLEAQPLDETEIQKLVNALHKDLDKYPTAEDAAGILRRNRAIAILIALYSGARVGEVAALRRRDIALTGQRMTICGNVVSVEGKALRQNKTKGKRTRSLTIDPVVIDALRKHLSWQDTYLEQTSKNTPICTLDGEHMQPMTLSQGFTVYRKELNLDPALTFHSLRHTHATMLLQQGINARIIQERLGHANVTTTLTIYSHVMPTNDGEAARAFSRVINS